MLQDVISMDDDDDESQIVPSSTLDSVVNHNTRIIQPMIENDLGPPSGSAFYEMINIQLSEYDCRSDMAEVPNEQNDLDEHCLPIHHDQCLTISFNSNNNEIEKASTEIIDKQLVDVDQMPVVTFRDCLSRLLSSDQSTALPLGSLDYDLLLANSRELQPSNDRLFESIIRPSAAGYTNMKRLATLGDSVLKLAVSLLLYHQYPCDGTGELTRKKEDQVENDNLYRLAMKKDLKTYLCLNELKYGSKEAKWSPPDDKIDEENSDRCKKKRAKQKAKRKVSADMMEALIGAFLISTNYSTTIKFMEWLGLDVIPIDQHDGIAKVPSVRQINKTNSINEIADALSKIYNERSFIDIETMIHYEFRDKAYLIAAFTHPSCSRTAVTIDYTRLKFVGNALFEFLITRYIFLTKKSLTSGIITKIRKGITPNNRKADIMMVNNLQTKIICSSPKLVSLKPLNPVDKHFSIDENVNQVTDSVVPKAVGAVFEALIAAIFFDSNCSLKTVWDIVDPLFRQCFDLDYSIEHPQRNPVELVHEEGGKFTDESIDCHGNFICKVELADGTEVKGSGESKKAAKENACKKVKK